MSSPTPTIRQLTATLAVAIGLVAAPSSHASGATSSRYGPTDGWYSHVTSLTSVDASRYGPRDGWYPYVVSGAFRARNDLRATRVSRLEVQLERNAAPKILTSAVSSDCPCNVGLPGGPAPRATLISATVTGGGGRFDWGDAGVGAGFTGALALLVVAAALMLRRHREFTGRYS